MSGQLKPLMLYIHIPYCVKKCLYCDFLSFGCSSEEAELKDKYIEALLKEIGYWGKASYGHEISSVFIGGGTPSILNADELSAICRALKANFEFSDNCEFTIECNPGTVDGKKLSAYRENGINRISFGLQSTDDEKLQLLGRIHRFDDFLKSFRLAREAGFDNINIDLMSALPGQTLAGLEQDIRNVLKLKPEHISAYSLIIEEGTRFYELYGEKSDEGAVPLPDEDTERQMYYLTEKLLSEYGYSRYEISNYSLSGMECRHNCGYWQGREYIGMGLGAASLFKGMRFSNVRRPDEYIQMINKDCSSEKAIDELGWIDGDEVCHLTKEDMIEEFMFLGLRMFRGVSETEFIERFGVTMDEIYGDVLDGLYKNGLAEKKDGRLRLTRKGTDLSNRVFAEFLL